MKVLVANYSFDASAQTVTFTDYAGPGIVLKRLFIISNCTDGILIYNFADPAITGAVSGNVLTVAFDTTVMSDTDDLLILYDDPAVADQPVSGPLTDAELRATPVPVSGTVTANAGTNLNTSLLATESTAAATAGAVIAAATSLQIVDDWDETDRAKVNPIVGQAGVAAGAGAVGATTQRTVAATDDPAVVSLAVIDDWDESDRAKVNPIVGQAGVAGGTGAAGATTQRTVSASDDPAVVALQLIDNAISGAGFNITQLGSAAVPIGAGTEAAAVRVTLPTNGTGLVAVQGTVAHDAAESGNPVGVGIQGVNHGASPTPVGSGERTRAVGTREGVQNVIGGSPNTKRFSTTYTTVQTDVVISAAAANKKAIVTAYKFAASNANTVDVACLLESGSTQLAAHPGLPRGGVDSEGNGSGKIAEGAANTDLTFSVSVPTGGSVSVNVTYYEIVEA